MRVNGPEAGTDPGNTVRFQGQWIVDPGWKQHVLRGCLQPQDDGRHLETRAHREKRSRHKSELDPFIDKVLDIEHSIISAHRDLANIIIHKDYTASAVNE